MATRATPTREPTLPPAGAEMPPSEPVLDVPIAAAAASKASRFSETPYFRYWVDPTRIVIRDGRAYWNPIRVAIEPGVGNTPISGDPSAIDGYQLNQLRRVPVPANFEVVAWGRVEVGYVRRKISHDDRGKRLVHHHDVWTRYEQQGTLRIEAFDQKGFQDFRVRVEALMAGPPADAIKGKERLRLQRSMDDHLRAGHTSGAAARGAEERAEQLAAPPPEPKPELPPLPPPEPTPPVEVVRREPAEPPPAATSKPRSRRVCSVPDCGKPHKAKGFCSAHYAQQRKTTTPTGAASG